MTAAPDPHDIAQQYGLAAVQTLVAALDSPDTHAAVKAAIALLAIGHGHPSQPIVLDSTGITVEIHTSEPDARSRANGKAASSMRQSEAS
jgi:hypothetical protein